VLERNSLSKTSRTSTNNMGLHAGTAIKASHLLVTSPRVIFVHNKESSFLRTVIFLRKM